MREQIMQFLDKGLMDLLSLIVTVIILPFLVVQVKRLKSDLISKVTESPNKYDDILLKLVTDLINESSGIETGNIAIKEALDNVKDKLLDNTKEKMKDEILKLTKKEALPLIEKSFEKVYDKLEKTPVGNDYGLNTNFQIKEAMKEHVDLLKKDVDGVLTGYAEAQFDKDGFNQGVIGATITKTI